MVDLSKIKNLKVNELPPPMTFEEFVNQYNLEVELTEGRQQGLALWWAKIANQEDENRAIGMGQTRWVAVEGLARAISGRRIKIRIDQGDFELSVPDLVLSARDEQLADTLARIHRGHPGYRYKGGELWWS